MVDSNCTVNSGERPGSASVISPVVSFPPVSVREIDQEEYCLVARLECHASAWWLDSTGFHLEIVPRRDMILIF